MRVLLMLAAVAFCLCSTPVDGQTQKVKVTIENLQPSDGFFITPVWTAFHNGGFDYFDAGSSASSAVELLAEGGDLSGLMADFSAFGSGQAGVLTGPGGFGSGAGQPPVIDPGEVSSMVFDLDTANRFLSVGTMIIPSNDGFFGNDDAMGIEIFDAMGNFTFSGPLEYSLSELWDAGTELNNGLGAAFSANGGSATDESMAIGLHGGLGIFDGTGTAAGTTINFANASGNPVFRLSVQAVPEPGSLALISILGCVGMLRRNRRAV